MSRWYLPYPTKENSQSGLTLIEILIAVIIISLIGIIFFPNLRKFNTDQQYRNELSNLKSSLESAKNMYSSGTFCTSSEPSTGWSVVVMISSNNPTSFNQKGFCVNAGAAVTRNLVSSPLSSLTLQSSTCTAPVTSMEMKFDKKGFSYSCNAGSFIYGAFSFQLQNKNNTSQSSTISINSAGTISQN